MAAYTLPLLTFPSLPLPPKPLYPPHTHITHTHTINSLETHKTTITFTTATKIHTINTLNNDTKTIAKSKSVVYDARIRKKGGLLVAGNEEGAVEVYLEKGRGTVRTWKEHTSAVRKTLFTPNNLQIVSTSDDRTARLWDLATEECLRKFNAHSDYVRAAACSNDSNIFVTGGYDNQVKVWDCRTPQGEMMTLEHKAAIEDIIMHPNGNIIYVASGNNVHVWDMTSYTRMHIIEAHAKAVTSLALTSGKDQLITGSLDQSVQIHDLSTFESVQAYRHNSPVISIGITEDNNTIGVGMSDGTLTIRRRKDPSPPVMKQKKRGYVVGTKRYFKRGLNLPIAQNEVDITIEQSRKAKLQPFELYLKSFEYGRALDEVIVRNNPVLIVSMIEELQMRQGLEISLNNRDERRLEPIIKFLVNNIATPRYTYRLINVTNIILDIYGDIITDSDGMNSLLHRLRKKVRTEIDTERNITEMLGQLESLSVMSLIDD